MLYDRDIREPLFEFLEDNFGKIRIIEEKQMGKSRADVMVVRDSSLTGIEIKSDADTYTRLSRQVLDYNRNFDYNYVVVGTSHAEHIEEHVPDWWGIITVDEENGVNFYVLRQPQLNPRCHYEFFRKRQISFLWRPEMAHIQELNGLYKYPGKSKRAIVDYLFESVPEEQLKKQITDELFERDYNAIAETIRAYKEKRGDFKRVKKRRRRKS